MHTKLWGIYRQFALNLVFFISQSNSFFFVAFLIIKINYSLWKFYFRLRRHNGIALKTSSCNFFGRQQNSPLFFFGRINSGGMEIRAHIRLRKIYSRIKVHINCILRQTWILLNYVKFLLNERGKYAWDAHCALKRWSDAEILHFKEHTYIRWILWWIPRLWFARFRYFPRLWL